MVVAPAQRAPSAGRPPAVPGVSSSVPSRGRRSPTGCAHLEDRLPGEGDDHAGRDLQVDRLVADAGDRSVQPAVVITGVPMAQRVLQRLRLRLLPLALPGRAARTAPRTTRAIRMIGKYCSTTDVPLYRACCSAVGAGPGSGPLGYVGCLGLVHGAQATGRDAHGRGRTSCAPAAGSLCAEQGL